MYATVEKGCQKMYVEISTLGTWKSKEAFKITRVIEIILAIDFIFFS